MKGIKLGLVAVLTGLSLIGCPFPNPNQNKPTDNKRHWADIEYIVEGKNGTPLASNITYGRIDGPNGNWTDGWYSTTTGSVSLPWNSGAHNDCTGHWVKIGASTGASPYTLILKIEDNGKVAASKEITGLGSLEYYIITQN